MKIPNFLKSRSNSQKQIWSLALTVVIFLALCLLYWLEITVLNWFPGEKILPTIRWEDVSIGLTIYLKTSVDFAILIGVLMSQYGGFKNQVIIQNGTALGNALGTMAVLVVWYFFKSIPWLLALMIFFASLVLLKLAQSSISHIEEADKDQNDDLEVSENIKQSSQILQSFLKPINQFFHPVLSKIVPDLNFQTDKKLTQTGLMMASFTIPFILGTDDFAGYVPLFNVVNVFGFGIGVFLGHAILNIFLFLNPKKTIQIVKNPIISVLGSLAFVLLALWGFYEAVRLLLGMH